MSFYNASETFLLKCNGSSVGNLVSLVKKEYGLLAHFL